MITSLVISGIAGGWWGNHCRVNNISTGNMILGCLAIGTGSSILFNMILHLP